MKMRKYILGFGCLIAFASVFLVSCLRDVDSTNKTDAGKSELTIQAAKEFFENNTGMILARSGNNATIMGRSKITPGDFTPLWNDAQTRSDGRVSIVDVPVMATNNYAVRRITVHNGKASGHKVNAVQKLIVIKKAGSEKLMSQMVTLIPDKNVSNSDIYKFSPIEKGHKFSGLVLLHTINGITIGALKYQDGVRVSVLKFKGKTHETIKEFIGDIKCSKKAQKSRYYDEDEGDDECNCGDCWECGFSNDGECIHCGEASCFGECQRCPSCGTISCPGPTCSWCSDCSCDGFCWMGPDPEDPENPKEPEGEIMMPVFCAGCGAGMQVENGFSGIKICPKCGHKNTY